LYVGLSGWPLAAVQTLAAQGVQLLQQFSQSVVHTMKICGL
jgi:hypothetical protein